MMTVSISDKVGRRQGLNLANKTDDVLAIQRLLKAVANKLENAQYDPGPETGAIEPLPQPSPTVNAIIAFQKRFMRTPDGNVDPGGRTLRMLNAAANPAVTVPAGAPAPQSLGTLSLNSFVGKSMSEICPNSFASTGDNHCAHFVGHALDITVGLTCRSMVASALRKGEAASIRVQEIFAACPSVQQYSNTLAVERGLMFVSAPGNFVTSGSITTLNNVPRKHIGVFLNGTIWHYSNSQSKVVTQTPAEFIKHYSGQTNALWIGTLPVGAIANFTA